MCGAVQVGRCVPSERRLSLEYNFPVPPIPNPQALAAVAARDGFAETTDSVFDDDNQWRRTRSDASQPTTPLSGAGPDQAPQLDTASSGAQRDGIAPSLQSESMSVGILGSGQDALSRAVAAARSQPSGTLGAAGAAPGTAFGGPRFWSALRRSGIEPEVRELLAEAKAALRRKGAIPLQMEADLKLARFLAGLHGGSARHEVSEIVSGMLASVEGMNLPEDRMLTFVEGAGVLGTVGSARKRMLLLWQAVELSKILGFPNLRSLEVACKVLEPPLRHTDPVGAEDPWVTGPAARGMHAGGSAALWPQVQVSKGDVKETRFL